MEFPEQLRVEVLGDLVLLGGDSTGEGFSERLAVLAAEFRDLAGQVCVLQIDGGQAVLHVDDRGPGVPPEQRERIFEPFYRLPGASEREGGVGLGLALVRSIAQRHGGSVTCDNRVGGGARFTLRLALDAPRGATK